MWTSADDNYIKEQIKKGNKQYLCYAPRVYPSLSWKKINPVTWYYMYGKIKMIEITLTTYGYKVWYRGVIKGMDNKRPTHHVDLLRHRLFGTEKPSSYYKTLAEAKKDASSFIKDKLITNALYYKEKK